MPKICRVPNCYRTERQHRLMYERLMAETGPIAADAFEAAHTLDDCLHEDIDFDYNYQENIWVEYCTLCDTVLD